MSVILCRNDILPTQAVTFLSIYRNRHTVAGATFLALVDLLLKPNGHNITLPHFLQPIIMNLHITPNVVSLTIILRHIGQRNRNAV